MRLAERIQMLSRKRIGWGSKPTIVAGAIRALKAILNSSAFAQANRLGQLEREWLTSLIERMDDELGDHVRKEAEKKHFVRAGWQFRRCGKSNCHCMSPAGELHGPYRYTRRRTENRRGDGKGVVYSSAYGGKR